MTTRTKSAYWVAAGLLWTAMPGIAATVPFTLSLTGTGSGASVPEARQNALNSLAGARMEFRALCRFAGGSEGFSSTTPESGTAAGYTITQEGSCSTLPPVQQQLPYSQSLTSQNANRDLALQSIAQQQTDFANTCIGSNRGVTVYSLLQESQNNGQFAFSVTGNCNPPDTAHPGAPSRLFVVPMDGAIEASWDPVPGASSYNLYYRTDNGVTPANGTRISVTSAPVTVANLTNGTNYFFVFTSIGPNGESGSSLVLGPVTPGPGTVAPLTIPAVPTFIRAAAGDSQVTVSWNPSTAATAYNVYMGTERTITIANAVKATTSGNGVSFLGLQNGTNYFFLVTAVSAVGESSPSALIGPEIPIAGGSTSRTLPYSILVSTTGSSASSALSTLSGIIQTLSTQCTATDKGVVRLGSVVELQTSPITEQQLFTCDVPAAPAVVAPAAPVSIHVETIGEGTVRISWNPVSGATSYNVYYGNDPQLTHAAKVSATSSPVTISGLSAGKPYYFAVTAVNQAGESQRSPAISALTNLNSVRIFPNPWRADRGYTPLVTFDQLTPGATVKIFTVSGHFVKALPTSGSTATWDLTNDAGQNVASGLYFYLITNSGDQRLRGELTVIR